VINSQNPKIVICSSLVLTRYSSFCLIIKFLSITNRKDAEGAELMNFPFAADLPSLKLWQGKEDSKGKVAQSR
jgi:hypothetical protein